MKAITLWQPWASLIAEGVKTIETRPKQHPWRSAIGQTIAIHAAKQEPTTLALGDYAVIPAQQWQRDAVREEGTFTLNGPLGWQFMPFGAVVATCTLVDIVPMLGNCGTDMGQPIHVCGTHGDYLLVHRPDWDPLDGETEFDVSEQHPFGDYAPGRFALLLDDVVKMEHPIPVQGHQGLWRLPREVEVLTGLMA